MMLFRRQEGNETDFETAALPYMDELYRTARRLTGSPTEAEDVVQETYLQAWKSFHRFESGTNCRAWLHKILFHVVQHYRRRSFRLVLKKDDEETFEDNLTYEPPIPEQVTDEDVLAAFERIPVHYREVVLLADVHEFAYREIAETLSIPVGTVMSRLNRGRNLLRQELGSFAAGYGIKQTGEARGQGV
jgi:RNA polymerase sigma-70 factor (ECF subfamily)